MRTVYRVNWPVPNAGLGQTTTVHTNTAECLTEEAAEQVRDGLRATGFPLAEWFRVDVAEEVFGHVEVPC